MSTSERCNEQSSIETLSTIKDSLKQNHIDITDDNDDESSESSEEDLYIVVDDDMDGYIQQRLDEQLEEQFQEYQNELDAQLDAMVQNQLQKELDREFEEYLSQQKQPSQNDELLSIHKNSEIFLTPPPSEQLHYNVIPSNDPIHSQITSDNSSIDTRPDKVTTAMINEQIQAIIDDFKSSNTLSSAEL